MSENEEMRLQRITVRHTSARESNSTKARDPIMISAEINGCVIQMELDTGAAVTIVSERIYRSIPEVELHPCSTQLTSYTGGNIGVMGRAEVEVRVAESIQPDVAHKLPIIIVEGTGRCLVGRDWLARIKLNWENIFYGTARDSVCPTDSLNIDTGEPGSRSRETQSGLRRGTWYVFWPGSPH